MSLHPTLPLCLSLGSIESLPVQTFARQINWLLFSKLAVWAWFGLERPSYFSLPRSGAHSNGRGAREKVIEAEGHHKSSFHWVDSGSPLIWEAQPARTRLRESKPFFHACDQPLQWVLEQESQLSKHSRATQWQAAAAFFCGLGSSLLHFPSSSFSEWECESHWRSHTFYS